VWDTPSRHVAPFCFSVATVSFSESALPFVTAMCESTFTFGQRGSHFFQCPTRRDLYVSSSKTSISLADLLASSTRLPTKLSSLLLSTQLQLVHHVALGYEDSFLITWRDVRGLERIDSYGLPPELSEFLHTRDAQQRYVRHVPAIQCSFGPYNESFFAHDGTSYRWMNLPGKLLSALQSRIVDGNWTDSPRLVELGADHDFVLITGNHALIWNLDHYKALSNLLTAAVPRKDGIMDIQSVALHAYRFGSFVIHVQNGTITHENVPQHSTPGLHAIVAAIISDTEAAKQKPLVRRESNIRSSLQRQSSNLQQRTQIRREWSEHKNQFTAQAKGIKLSISLSIGVNGIARLLG